MSKDEIRYIDVTDIPSSSRSGRWKKFLEGLPDGKAGMFVYKTERHRNVARQCLYFRAHRMHIRIAIRCLKQDNKYYLYVWKKQEAKQ